jgi:hypothetical protein
MTCLPSQPADPSPDSSVRLSYYAPVPAGVTQVAVPLYLTAGTEVLGFNLPLRLRVAGAVPGIDSVQYGTYAEEISYWDVPPSVTYREEPDSGEVLLAALEFFVGEPLPVGQNSLATLFLTVSPSGVDRELSIDWADMSPIEAVPHDYPAVLNPVVIAPGSADKGGNGATFLPQFTPTLTTGGCCQGGYRGNIDYDPGDMIDISDLVYMVDYMFTSGPAPVCFEEADLDGVGGINISDLVYLVDFFFSGGPAPLPCP